MAWRLANLHRGFAVRQVAAREDNVHPCMCALLAYCGVLRTDMHGAGAVLLGLLRRELPVPASAGGRRLLYVASALPACALLLLCGFGAAVFATQPICTLVLVPFLKRPLVSSLAHQT